MNQSSCVRLTLFKVLTYFLFSLDQSVSWIWLYGLIWNVIWELEATKTAGWPPHLNQTLRRKCCLFLFTVSSVVLENAAVLMYYFIILTKTCRLGFSLSISLCCFVGDNINCILGAYMQAVKNCFLRLLWRGSALWSQISIALLWALAKVTANVIIILNQFAYFNKYKWLVWASVQECGPKLSSADLCFTTGWGFGVFTVWQMIIYICKSKPYSEMPSG